MNLSSLLLCNEKMEGRIASSSPPPPEILLLFRNFPPNSESREMVPTDFFSTAVALRRFPPEQ